MDRAPVMEKQITSHLGLGVGRGDPLALGVGRGDPPNGGKKEIGG